MKKFEIKLWVEGEITLLPDSQKLFGYLMDKLSQSSSEKEVSNFIKDIKGKCMVSNLMPSDHLPTPKGYLMGLVQEKKNYEQMERDNEDREIEKLRCLIEELNKLKGKKKNKEKNKEKNLEDQIRTKIKEIEEAKQKMTENAKKKRSISSKAIYETLKGMEYIKRGELPKLIEKIRTKEISTDLLKEYEYIVKNQKYVQKFKLESQVRGIPGFPNIAYSLPIVEYKNKMGNLQREFSFFVVAEEDSILVKGLRKAKDEKGDLWTIGPKASSGYNCYSLKEISECDYESDFSEKGCYINLGMLLPQENTICWERSVIDIYSSDRRPFELVGDTKKVISFISMGSILSCSEKRAYNIGKSIKNEYNKLYPDAIVFGNSYLEPLEV